MRLLVGSCSGPPVGGVTLPVEMKPGVVDWNTIPKRLDLISPLPMHLPSYSDRWYEGTWSEIGDAAEGLNFGPCLLLRGRYIRVALVPMVANGWNHELVAQHDGLLWPRPRVQPVVANSWPLVPCQTLT